MENPPRKTTLTLGEAAVVTAICFGWFIAQSAQSVWADYPDVTFTNANAFALLLEELVLAGATWWYLRARRFDVASLVPRPSWRGTLNGVVLYVVVLITVTVVVALVSQLGVSDSVGFSSGTLSWGWLLAISLVNGCFEEVFMLGVLVRGLRGFGLAIAVALPLLVRMSYHTYQGPLGTIHAGVYGLMLTGYYVARGSLWAPVLAHVLADAVALAL